MFPGIQAHVGGRWRTIVPPHGATAAPPPVTDFYGLFDEAARRCDEYLAGRLSDAMDARLRIAVRQLLLNYYYYYEVLPEAAAAPSSWLVYPRIGRYAAGRRPALGLPTRYSLATLPLRFAYGQLNHWRERRASAGPVDILAFLATGFKRRILDGVLARLPGVRVHVVQGEVWSRDLTSGSGLPPDVATELEAASAVLSPGHGAVLRYRAANVVQILRRYRPRVLVTFEENNVNGALHGYVGRRFGVPVVAVAHAYSAGQTRRDSPFDYHVVFGRASADNIRRMNGVIDGDILPLGSPLHDEVVRRPDEPPTPTRHRILLISNCPLPGREAAWRQEFVLLRDVLERFPTYHFLFKPHYSEDASVPAAVLGPLGNVSFAPRDARLDGCVDRTGAAVMLHYPFSNAGFEVMLGRRPLMIFNKDGWSDSFGFVARGVPEARTADRLAELLAGVDAVPSSCLDEMRDDYFANLGRASEAVAELLGRVMQPSGPVNPGSTC